MAIKVYSSLFILKVEEGAYNFTKLNYIKLSCVKVISD